MQHQDYAKASQAHLAADPDFQRWALDPTPADLHFWLDFLAEYPDQLDKLEGARKQVLAARGKAPDAKLSAARKQELHDRLLRSIPRRRRINRYRTWAWSAAAAVLLLILAGVVYQTFGGVTEPEWVTIVTPYGEAQEVVLPDGSQVVLNANSRLSYPPTWATGADREVRLTGEAYFTVQPLPATGAKFTVVTKDLRVNVLGTVFNVHARQRGTRVTLEEGKVDLQLKAPTPQGDRIAMEPGEEVLFSVESQQLVVERFDPELEQNTWKDGIILFDAITLGELGQIIQETFGREVVFRDSTLRQQRITGAGPADDLDLLLETVQEAFAIQITERDSVLIIE